MSNSTASTSAVEPLLWQVVRRVAENATAEGDHGGGDDDHSDFGVHITYEDLYTSIIFLTCIYVAGMVASTFLRMPDLVGQIVCGIILGPPLLDYIPNAEAWVMLGEMG